MFREFSLGIIHFFKAFGFLASNRLLHYYLYPVLAAVIYYLGLFILLLNFSKSLVERLLGAYFPDKLPEITSLGSFGEFLSHVSLYGLSALLFSIIAFLIAGKLSKYILLIVLSPVFALLSERVEELISGKSYPFDWIQFLQDILRGILLALRNFCVEMFFIGILSLMGLFLPFLSLILTPTMVLISSYFYGFSMIDYINERRRMSIHESVRQIRKRKWFATGLGLMYWLFDGIPILGLILTPINSVTGSVTGLNELER